MSNAVIGWLIHASDFSVWCRTPSGNIHFTIISLSSGVHTCAGFLCLAHCHSSGVSIDDVQEEVSRVVVRLACVACSDSVTRPQRWLCAGQKAVRACPERSTVPFSTLAWVLLIKMCPATDFWRSALSFKPTYGSRGEIPREMLSLLKSQLAHADYVHFGSGAPSTLLSANYRRCCGWPWCELCSPIDWKYPMACWAGPWYSTLPSAISVRLSNNRNMEYRGWWMEKIIVLPCFAILNVKNDGDVNFASQLSA